jgi:hypothetical protein
MQQDTIRDLLRSTQGDAENAQLKEQLASVMSENSSLQCKLDEATKSVRSYTEIVTEHYELSASLEHKVAELTEEVCVAASPFILAIVDLSLCMVHGAWCMVHGAWCTPLWFSHWIAGTYYKCCQTCTGQLRRVPWHCSPE